MRDVSIIAIGQIAVGEHWEKSIRHLAADAILAALKETNPARIDAMYIGNMMSGEATGQEHLGALIADFVGLRGVEAGKSSGLWIGRPRAHGIYGPCQRVDDMSLPAAWRRDTHRAKSLRPRGYGCDAIRDERGLASFRSCFAHATVHVEFGVRTRISRGSLSMRTSCDGHSHAMFPPRYRCDVRRSPHDRRSDQPVRLLAHRRWSCCAHFVSNGAGTAVHGQTHPHHGVRNRHRFRGTARPARPVDAQCGVSVGTTRLLIGRHYRGGPRFVRGPRCVYDYGRSRTRSMRICRARTGCAPCPGGADWA